jgi:hypothetical protein
MATGMVTLIAFIIYLNFCPRMGMRKLPPGTPPPETVTPQVVFFAAGCVGVMLGGMFGGVIKHIW